MLIYLITNKINGKKYVGQTTQGLEQRWRRHCWDCTADKSNMPVSKAIKKYGKENFAIEILDNCTSLEELNAKEKYYAQELKTFSPNGYNLRAGNGLGSMTDETKRKISIGNKGKKISAETLKKQSESHKGHAVLDSTKKKLSILNKGKRGSALCYQRLVEITSKMFYLVSPSGEEIIFKNMALFCRINNLSASQMCMVVKGKRLCYKGWKRQEAYYRCFVKE